MRSSLVLKNGLFTLGSQIFPAISTTIIVLFNYINFGVGFSVTQKISGIKKLDNQVEDLSKIFNSALLFTLLLSIIVTGAGYITLPSLIDAITTNDTAPEIRLLAFQMFQCIFLGTPVFLSLILFRSCLEGIHLFRITSLNRAVLNTLLFIAPALSILGYIPKEYILVLVTLVYTLSSIGMFYQCKKHLKIKIQLSHISKNEIIDLITFGGWTTILTSSAIIFYYLDRFIIGSILGFIAVAYYTASYDLASRMNIISGSLSSSIIPAVSNWKRDGK
jgi:O-antigen/teichoic acid export membrane protein